MSKYRYYSLYRETDLYDPMHDQGHPFIYDVFRVDSSGKLELNFFTKWDSAYELVSSLMERGFVEVSENKARLLFKLDGRYKYSFDS